MYRSTGSLAPRQNDAFSFFGLHLKNRTAAKYYRRACQNYSFVNIIRHFQLQHVHLRQSLTTNGFVLDYVSDNVSDLS